jgi:inorganic triphosphatase YgiF
MGMEIELKYRANEAVQAKVAGDFGPWQKIAMETTYYDTPSGALSQRRMTLRRRLENGVSICTVKTPAGDLGRGEWDTEAGRIEDAIEKLCQLGCPRELEELVKEGLLEVCGARFTRHCCPVELPGAVVELALDAGILFSGDRQEALCEIEAELKSGTAEALVEFGASFARDYGLEAEDRSKFRRALALWEERNHGI